MASILIIDDDENFRTVLKKMLEKTNHAVLDAANGLIALDLFKKNEIDLVITDLIMPEKDGIMTIQELRILDPRIKIIAISGGPGGNTAWLPIAKKVGAMRTLKKPFTHKTLVNAVEKSLVGHPPI